MPCPSIANGTSFSAVPSRRAAAIGSEPMKPVSSLQHQPRPASIGLRVLAHVVAVKVEADLEPQRVARAEPDRRRAAGDQRVPDLGRVLGTQQQLDAVLAGVTGAAHEHRRPRHRALADVEARRQRAVGEPPHELAGPRALHREHREVGGAVEHVDVEPVGVRLQPREVLLVVGRVGHGQERALRQPVGEQVVEHATVLAAHDAVLRPALGDPAHVVGEHPLEELGRVRARGLDLAHVRDVEHADAGPHRDVLLADAGVLDRHLPAGERNQLRAGGRVAVVQGSAA